MARQFNVKGGASVGALATSEAKPGNLEPTVLCGRS